MNKSHEKTLATSENNFGEVVRVTGPMAKANPFRFSTKYEDDETDLLYYGFRYLRHGWWISRDPAGERGGRNLYSFVRNEPLDSADGFGLCPIACSNSRSSNPHNPCTSRLYPTYSEPQMVDNLREIFTICDNTIACAITTPKFTSQCKRCGCDWKIVAEVRSNCQIYYADPTLYGVEYLPDIDHMFRHEECHCEDAITILEEMLTLYDTATYASSERCEEIRKYYDSTFLSRFRDKERAKSHVGDKWKEGGDCYAYGVIR